MSVSTPRSLKYKGEGEESVAFHRHFFYLNRDCRNVYASGGPKYPKWG